MRIENYISFKFRGEELESEFQYEAAEPKAHYEQQPELLKSELWRFYYRQVFRGVSLSQMTRFFDFHLNKFEGDPGDFVFFVNQSPQLISSKDVEHISNTRFRDDLAKVLVSWLAKADGIAARKRIIAGNADPRITGVLSEEVTRNYFMGVFTAKSRKGKHKGTQIMSEEEVDLFLGAAFAGFPYVELKHKLKTNAQQLYVKRAVYKFYEVHRYGSQEASEYCSMLIEVFDVFKNYANPGSLLRSFAESADKKTELFLGNFLGSCLGN